MSTKRTSNLPLICLVCGDIARGINFDLMTCASCKTFFRRHATKSNINLQCASKNNCNITQKTRSLCSACRLQKCFKLGMNPKLVGNRFQNLHDSNHNRSSKIINNPKYQLPQPLSINLLQNDRSTLTTDEWNLLSNILHAYDVVNIIPHAKYLLEQQSLLPPKLRSKSSTMFDTIKFFFSSFQLLLEHTPYFHNLSSDTCEILLRYNSATFGTLNSMFIMREVNALDYPAFVIGCNTIYGYETMEGAKKFTKRLEQNGILVKLILLIIAFSTNLGIVIFDCSIDMKSISNSMSLFTTQNIFITMFWKYLIYQYGSIDAIRWFNSFIKYILDIIQSMNERDNAQHNDMIDVVIEETVQLLAIDD